MTIWNTWWSFGIHMNFVPMWYFGGTLVYFSEFWYIVAIKIWQLCVTGESGNL
jgi:hypothetical protein